MHYAAHQSANEFCKACGQGTLPERSVIKACAKAGEVAAAEHWRLLVMEAGVKADVVSFNTVITACAKAGDVDRAEGWLCTMQEAEVKPNKISYHSVIEALAEAGTVTRAEHWLLEMMESGEGADTSSCNTVIRARHRHPFKIDYWMSQMGKNSIEPDLTTYCLALTAWGAAGGAAAREAHERPRHWMSEMLKAGSIVIT